MIERSEEKNPSLTEKMEARVLSMKLGYHMMSMSEKPAILGGRPIREKMLGEWPIITEEEIEAVTRVLRRRKLFASMYSGVEVPAFEEEFSKAMDAKYTVAVSSGTAALDIALAALGVGPGDEVITTPYSFIASATCILMNHAIPVFADVDPRTRNIDPEEVRKKITERTKAIVVVHMAGHPAEMDAIMEIAEEHDLYVVEDSAQAHLAEYKGRKVGTIGHIGIFSFQESKSMTSGEGGAIVTNDEELAEECRSLREHGRRRDKAWYYHEILGWNYRMTEMQAAILRVQLKRLPKIIEERRRNAEYLSKLISEFEEISPPYVAPHVKHSWYLYFIDYKPEKVGLSKLEFAKAVQAEGIPLFEGYVWPLYENPLFRDPSKRPVCPFKCPYYGKDIEYPKGLCPVAEKLCYESGMWLPGRVLNAPRDELEDVPRAIEKVLRYAHDIAKALKK